MKTKVRKLSYNERWDELEAMGVVEIKTNFCLTCLNVKSLPNCPNDCDGHGRPVYTDDWWVAKHGTVEEIAEAKAHASKDGKNHKPDGYIKDKTIGEVADEEYCDDCGQHLSECCCDKDEGYEGRIKELETMGISEDTLKSEWCLDCVNIKSLSDCPKGCDGIGLERNPSGYIRDETVEWKYEDDAK